MRFHVGRVLGVATLAIGILGSAGISARAAEDPPANPEGRDKPLFGGAGSLVIAGGTRGWQQSALRDDASGGASAASAASLSLSLDTFLVHRWSVGVAGDAAWSRGPARGTGYALEARLGRAFPLGPYATLWPVLGVGASRRDGPGAGPARTGLTASLDASVLVHPSRHLFLGAGPIIRAVLDGNSQTLELSGQTFLGGAIGR